MLAVLRRRAERGRNSTHRKEDAAHKAPRRGHLMGARIAIRSFPRQTHHGEYQRDRLRAGASRAANGDARPYRAPRCLSASIGCVRIAYVLNGGAAMDNYSVAVGNCLFEKSPLANGKRARLPKRGRLWRHGQASTTG